MCTLFLSKGKSWRKWTKEHFLRYGYCDNDQLGRYFKWTHSVLKCKHIIACWFHTEVGGHLSTPAYMEVYIHFWESVMVIKLTPFSTQYFVEMDNPDSFEIFMPPRWDFQMKLGYSRYPANVCTFHGTFIYWNAKNRKKNRKIFQFEKIGCTRR